MRNADFTHRSAIDAIDIHVHGWAPPEGDTPKAILHVAHGMAEHGARYARMASAFVDQGWVVYAQDHRGHGRSVPPGGMHGHMGGKNPIHAAGDDLADILATEREKHPGLPQILFGHSMGSFIAQWVAMRRPEGLSGLVLSGSNGSPPPIAQAGRLVTRLEAKRLGRKGISPILSALSFEDFNRKFAPNRTESDWISRDPDEVDAYIADPYCGFACTVETWQGLLDTLPAIGDTANVRRIPSDLPVYMFSGDQDPVGEFGAGVRRLYDAYREAGIERVELVLYPGGRHEMLNETNRDEVTRALVGWCERTASHAA